MVRNIRLEVVGLVLPFVLEGVQLLFKLPHPALSKAWSEKRDLEFLKSSADIAGLAELVDA